MGLDGDSAVIRNKKVIMIKSKFLISCVLAFASVFVSEAEPKCSILSVTAWDSIMY